MHSDVLPPSSFGQTGAKISTNVERVLITFRPVCRYPVRTTSQVSYEIQYTHLLRNFITLYPLDKLWARPNQGGQYQKEISVLANHERSWGCCRQHIVTARSVSGYPAQLIFIGANGGQHRFEPHKRQHHPGRVERTGTGGMGVFFSSKSSLHIFHYSGQRDLKLSI